MSDEKDQSINEKDEEKTEINIWTPEDVFKTYDQMFNEFRRNLMNTWTSSPLTEPRYWEQHIIPRMTQNPPMDLIDNGDSFKVVAEVPGFDKEDIQIEITENSISVTGKKESTTETARRDYRLNEIRSRSFSRSLRFPEKVVSKEGKASLKSGVLEVTVPKETPTNLEKKYKVKIE